MITAPRTFAAKADATRWLATTESDQYRGLWLDPAGGQLTLVEYAGGWLNGKVTLAPRTREIYESQLRLHILPAIAGDVPALGEMPLNALGPELIRGWYGALRVAKGRSVAAKAYTRLRQILTQAVDDDRIAKNPCRIDGGGAERHPEQQFASLHELYHLADTVPERYRALVLTAGLSSIADATTLSDGQPEVDL